MKYNKKNKLKLNLFIKLKKSLVPSEIVQLFGEPNKMGPSLFCVLRHCPCCLCQMNLRTFPRWAEGGPMNVGFLLLAHHIPTVPAYRVTI